MAYLGNRPAEAYSAFQKQDFSTSATTSYTLDHPVSNQNEIALFINFVRQEPTAAYTASGTTLTLTSATSGSDDMYCIYLGKAVQTVNPPSGSVGTAQIADLAVTSGKLASGVLPTNTPAFFAYLNTKQTVSDNTNTKIQIEVEDFDTDGAYDTSTYKFQPQTAGKYCVNVSVLTDTDEAGATSIDGLDVYIYKNGSQYANSRNDMQSNEFRMTYATVEAIIDFNGSSDYVEGFVYFRRFAGATTATMSGGSVHNEFTGYKIIE